MLTNELMQTTINSLSVAAILRIWKTSLTMTDLLVTMADETSLPIPLPHAETSATQKVTDQPLLTSGLALLVGWFNLVDPSFETGHP